jgi:VIT1/CCC1 family predicted Fe2+/Mn2+ transporter
MRTSSSIGASSTTRSSLPSLHWDDLLATVAIFLIVFASTFPVVLPFVLIQDVAVAKDLSRAIALAMLFFRGRVLGRYACYGSWKVGFMMAALGTALVGASRAPGG